MDNFEYEVAPIEVDGAEPEFKPDNPLRRPDIHWGRFIAAVSAFAVLIAAMCFISQIIICRICPKTEHTIMYTILCCAAAALIYLLCIGKRAVIWFVHLYQHCAPDEVRLRCVFEPSCSEYMILAVEKYGAAAGVCKGLIRLLRCHPPGGVDYP